eukprot:UN19278
MFHQKIFFNSLSLILSTKHSLKYLPCILLLEYKFGLYGGF